MDYEKKYKNALNWIESIYSTLQHEQQMEAEGVFPELAESEDEKIRKEIISIVKSYRESCITEGNHRFEECLTWLKKQGKKANPYSGISFEYNGHTWGMCARDNGVDILLDKQLFTHLERQSEQKNPCEDCSNPKLNCSNFPCIERRAFDSGKSVFECIKTEHEQVEPKFKVGDWLQYRSAEPFLVEEITEQGYINGNSCLPFEWENETHLWTIQDAKEGDVLACNEEILLFKSFSVQGRISLYCWYNGQTKNFYSKEVDNTSLTTRNKIFPSTKEQRDILFAKMKEAGYEWNADRKKLKRIKKQDIPKDYNSVDPYFGKNIEMKPSWTEEDISKVQRICKYLDEAKNYFGDVTEIRECIEWVNSIKDRIGFGLICTIRESTNEHGPTDNKSKFHVGDWIVMGNTVGQILYVLRDCYVGIDTNGKTFTLSKTEGNSDIHLWTIKDAKDGDVLATWAGAFIYNNKKDGSGCPGSYCGINTLGRFQICTETYWTSKVVNPATKEQQDYLFQKMGEYGYIWDDHAKMLICSTNMKSK